MVEPVNSSASIPKVVSVATSGYPSPLTSESHGAPSGSPWSWTGVPGAMEPSSSREVKVLPQTTHTSWAPSLSKSAESTPPAGSPPWTSTGQPGSPVESLRHAFVSPEARSTRMPGRS